ncbi:MAG: hypothetical protein ACRDTR_25190, partial [Rubrobacter sp.]
MQRSSLHRKRRPPQPRQRPNLRLRRRRRRLLAVLMVALVASSLVFLSFYPGAVRIWGGSS